MFEIENFDLKLNTEFIGRNFIYVEEIDSTNTFLLDRSNNITQNGTVVLAESQTSGRGRKDRTWQSQKESNLTFSVLLFKEKKLFEKLNLINFAAALAVATAIENLYQLRTNLKWPNDVLINSKKTSGILVESSSSGNNIERVIVGIGVNVNQTSFQGKFNYPPTSIKHEFKKQVERERLLAEILNLFEFLLNKIKTNNNYVLNEWRSKCNMIGEKISVHEGEEIKYGKFEDIDENGFLLLKTKDGIEKITVGDLNVS